MIELARDDALKGLKRFSRLAEHAAYVSQYTADPEYWRVQANTRKSVYLWLSQIVQTQGVDQAYLIAQERYADLPLQCSDPKTTGQRDALERFFAILGVNPPELEGETPANAQIEG
ncbi:MAG: hypothetical protein GX205_06185 [Firmicutes bacterium]|nr:hypothetical protein [Bacillota bacterium]